MFKKLIAGTEVLKKGRVVANPAAWKRGQITASMLTALIWALVHAAEAWGYDVPIGSETVDAVSVGVIAAVNWLCTLASSDKVGLPSLPRADR